MLCSAWHCGESCPVRECRALRLPLGLIPRRIPQGIPGSLGLRVEQKASAGPAAPPEEKRPPQLSLHHAQPTRAH